MDLDLFDDHRAHRPDRRRGRPRDDDHDADDSGRWRRDDHDRDDRDDDDHDDDRRMARGYHRDDHRDRDDRRRGRGRSYRRAHPHVFAWALMAGGALVLGLLAIAVLQATGLMGPIADLYFAATTAIMPASWHDEWRALPGVVHVVGAVVALAVVVGIAGEALEFLD